MSDTKTLRKEVKMLEATIEKLNLRLAVRDVQIERYRQDLLDAVKHQNEIYGQLLFAVNEYEKVVFCVKLMRKEKS